MRKKINRQLLANSDSCIRMTHIDSSGFHHKNVAVSTSIGQRFCLIILHVYTLHLSQCVYTLHLQCMCIHYTYHSVCVYTTHIIVYVYIPHLSYCMCIHYTYHSVCVHILVYWQARLKQMNRGGPVAYHLCKQMQFYGAVIFSEKFKMHFCTFQLRLSNNSIPLIRNICNYINLHISFIVLPNLLWVAEILLILRTCKTSIYYSISQSKFYSLYSSRIPPLQG